MWPGKGGVPRPRWRISASTEPIRQEQVMIIDCPLCEGPVRTEASVPDFRCEDCCVTVDFAPEPGDALELPVAA